VNKERECVPVHLERHFTLTEAARELQIGMKRAKAIFESEPGVLIVPGKLVRRKRKAVRIPASVLERVRERISRHESNPQTRRTRSV
jgi:hypothetical protein